jgi:hypothetical protein
MRMVLRASAVALVTMGFVFFGGLNAPARAQEVVLTEGKIAQIRSALQLSPAQEVHWRSLMLAVRETLARQQTDDNGGFVQRVKTRVGSYVLNAVAMRRISAAAQPLIMTLNEEQKRDGMNAVRNLGVASLF